MWACALEDGWGMWSDLIQRSYKGKGLQIFMTHVKGLIIFTVNGHLRAGLNFPETLTSTQQKAGLCPASHSLTGNC